MRRTSARRSIWLATNVIPGRWIASRLPRGSGTVGRMMRLSRIAKPASSSIWQAFTRSITRENFSAYADRSTSVGPFRRSEEHTSELQSLMRISYAVFCLKKKNITHPTHEESDLHQIRTRTDKLKHDTH